MNYSQDNAASFEDHKGKVPRPYSIATWAAQLPDTNERLSESGRMEKGEQKADGSTKLTEESENTLRNRRSFDSSSGRRLIDTDNSRTSNQTDSDTYRRAPLMLTRSPTSSDTSIASQPLPLPLSQQPRSTPRQSYGGYYPDDSPQYSNQSLQSTPLSYTGTSEYNPPESLQRQGSYPSYNPNMVYGIQSAAQNQPYEQQFHSRQPASAAIEVLSSQFAGVPQFYGADTSPQSASSGVPSQQASAQFSALSGQSPAGRYNSLSSSYGSNINDLVPPVNASLSDDYAQSHQSGQHHAQHQQHQSQNSSQGQTQHQHQQNQHQQHHQRTHQQSSGQQHLPQHQHQQQPQSQHQQSASLPQPQQNTSQAMDDAYKQYQDAIRSTFMDTRDGNLVDAGDTLLAVSDWLLSNAVDLGLVRDEQALHADRTRLWNEFNMCWLSVIQKEKELLSQLVSANQEISSARNILKESDLEKLGRELIRLCDGMEKHGLVDYQMGVWEEEILEALQECLDMLESNQSPAGNRSPSTEELQKKSDWKQPEQTT